MIGIETLLFTSNDRADLFDWQSRAMAAHPRKRAVRVDTWTIEQHPCPGGDFTLYAMTIVLADVMQETGEMTRQFLGRPPRP